MNRRPQLASIARVAAVLSLGALALHQLSYMAAHGAAAPQVLVGSGHGYLAALAPLVGVAAVSLAFAGVVIPALRGQRARVHGSFEARALLLAGAMLAVFVTQELLEALVINGHAAGALLAGGWLTMPVALALGALSSLALSGLAAVTAMISRDRERERPLRPERACPAPTCSQLTPLPARALAFGFARRPPPLRV